MVLPTSSVTMEGLKDGNVELCRLEFAKFRGSRAIAPSWVRSFFSWVPLGSKIFSRQHVRVQNFPHGYCVGPRYFFVGISWVQNFFSWVFRGSKIL